MHLRRLLVAALIGVLLVCCGAQAAVLQITVIDEATSATLGDVSIYIDGDFIGTTGAGGVYTYTHTGDASFSLKAMKSGYASWVGLIDPATASVLVEMSRKSEVLAIDLYDAETLQPVSNAVVQVHGDGVDGSESTDANGRADFLVKAGSLYNVEIRAQSYYPLSKTVQMASSERVVQYWLYRSDKFAVLVQDSQTRQPLAGAAVAIDSVPAGTTGADGLLPLHLQREQRYSIQVEKPDYQTYRADRLIAADDVLLTVPLARSTYPVSIMAFDETKRPVENAEVVINGTWQGRTDSYGRYGLQSVEAGSYLIEVSASGFQTWTEICRIDRSGEEIIADLACDQADVTVVTADSGDRVLAGAVVLVDGQQVGTTDEQGTIRTSLKASETYNVSASLDGYRFTAVEVTIPIGTSTKEVTLHLESELGLFPILGIIGLLAGGVVIAVWGARRRSGRRLRKPKQRSL
ncbi:hypothetical protein FGU65_15005 [Methanoculleus sp. FWC-SCC1]|uniref:PEGA domain-containing protein n=1 Tax=Methanoculleus frigidifontis TaxID=2584085 RepID=A0ABT8ME03_9EURY|nr:carboxypeptidase-like regulatory domain-containing protein [Methanoculleus sp. FWC-SCC1]MDN7026170.1 hypothetical protein [Methanoculleus sp. FWC-SCC1]